jgi:hypothetical protein
MGAFSQLAAAATGSGAAARSVRRPVFELTVGGSGAKDWRGALVSFTAESTLAPSVDFIELLVSPLASAPSVSLDDDAELSAGYGDDTAVKIFHGKVGSLRGGVRGPARIGLANGGAALALLRLNQAYEQQTAGQIVSDLASRASVDTGTIEDGVTYPYYVVADDRSAWRHIAELSRHNDCIAFFDADGALNVQSAAPGSPVQTFTCGMDVLALDGVSASPVGGQVTIIGEGAAGSQGQDAWGWLLQDASSVTAQSGDGDPVRQFAWAAARSAEAARQAAAGAAGAFARAAVRGFLVVCGAPAVIAGSAIEIAGASVEALNGPALAERVIHRYSKSEGFTTTIGFSTAAGGAL